MLLLVAAGSQRCTVEEPKPCGGETRENVIVLRNQTEAGVGDRLYLFGKMALWADALCARLIVESPATMLAKSHNGGRRVHKSRAWSHYLAATNGDGDPLLSETSITNITNAHDVIVTQGNGTAANITEQFHEASQKDNPFVWYISESFYPHFVPGNIPDLWRAIDSELTNCTKPSVLTLSMDQNPLAADAFRALDVHDSKDPVVTIHVRRTDSTRFHCDTSSPRVLAGVTCAIRKQQDCGVDKRWEADACADLGDTLSLRVSASHGPFRFVLFTDDTNLYYIHDVQAALTQDDAFPNSTFTYGDPIVASVLDQAGYGKDNYLTYVTEKAIRRFADLDVTFEHKASGTCASAAACVNTLLFNAM